MTIFTARRNAGIASAVLARAIPSVCPQDEKSAAKFHYIKTLSGKVVAQSIAFRVVSIYWQVVAPFP